jgi:Do/DeqQ family serine protease
MDLPSPQRALPWLLGIGLVLVGLLAGILVMLVADRATPDAPPVAVEPIEIGRRAARAATLYPDSMAPVVMVDPFRLNQLFQEVANRIRPSVVYIEVEVESSGRNWFHRDVEAQQSVGSGVLISEKGYLVTNNHVVEDAADIRVILTDKREFPARIVGTDAKTDLAVLKIDETANLPIAPIGDSDQVQVGEWVLAVGNPFRLTSTVTAGIVSALGRQVDIIEGGFGIEDFIQTDAAINPGNSGGALVNLRGELVGISTAIATETGSYEGYGFAVPARLMERVVRDLIAYGAVKRGYLGVEIQEINAARAADLGLPEVHGVYLDQVWSSGPAYQAGLRSGDVVLTIDEHPIPAPNALQSLIARYRPGERIRLKVWRNGQIQQFQVRLFGDDDPAYQTWLGEVNQSREQPVPEDLPPERPPESLDAGVLELADWGVGLRNLSNRERTAFDLDHGVYVAYVEANSRAEAAGLPRDVVIVRVGTRLLYRAEDAQPLFEKADADDGAVLLRIKRRDGLTAFFELTPEPTP